MPQARDVPDPILATKVAVTPLQKCRRSGEFYVRDPRIETLIAELTGLPRAELLARARIANRNDPDYVPSECLVYFIRASRYDNNELWFESIYRILIARLLRSLPRAENSDNSESLVNGVIRDKVRGRFVELLSADRVSYVDKLDYFEVRFDGAVAKLRCDAWRSENVSMPLAYEEESGELLPEVEEAAAGGNLLARAESEHPVYRLSLNAAIVALPPEQRRVIHLLNQGFPIDSQEPDVMTITRVLGKSEKTIRNYRDKARAALRPTMAAGEQK